MNPQKKAGLFIVILIGVLMVLVIGLISGAAAYKAYDNHNSVDDFDQIQDSKLFLEFIEEKGRLKNVTVMFFKNSTKPTFMPPDSCGLYDHRPRKTTHKKVHFRDIFHKGDAPTSIRSHFPFGIIAPKLVNFLHSCS